MAHLSSSMLCDEKRQGQEFLLLTLHPQKNSTSGDLILSSFQDEFGPHRHCNLDRDLVLCFALVVLCEKSQH